MRATPFTRPLAGSGFKLNLSICSSICSNPEKRDDTLKFVKHKPEPKGSESRPQKKIDAALQNWKKVSVHQIPVTDFLPGTASTRCVRCSKTT
jgi:hypothetical protein